MSDPINEILAFGEDSTNVLAQVDYSADAGRLAGQMPGLARSALNNTALRQVTRVCRGLAQFIAENYAPGVVDDGDVAKIVAGIEAAIAEVAPTPGAATEEAAGIAQLATEAEALAGTDDTTIITPAKLAAALAAVGGPTVDEFYIDAGAMTPAITGGAASGQEESTTNKVNRQYMSFRGDTANTIAQFSARMPSNWDAGTVKAKLLWEPASGASAGDEVRWLFSAVAVGNDDALDAAFGTPVNIDDAAIAAGDAHETPASAAMTIGGTPAVGDLVTFKVERDYDYGSQPLAEHARLLGMVIQYGVSGTITAW